MSMINNLFFNCVDEHIVISDSINNFYGCYFLTNNNRSAIFSRFYAYDFGLNAYEELDSIHIDDFFDYLYLLYVAVNTAEGLIYYPFLSVVTVKVLGGVSDV